VPVSLVEFGSSKPVVVESVACGVVVSGGDVVVESVACGVVVPTAGVVVAANAVL
jgi:hypothetical protein